MSWNNITPAWSLGPRKLNETSTPCHVEYYPSEVEEACGPDVLPTWRRFRIEYGFECSCPEGIIYIKDGPDIFDRLDQIMALLRGEKNVSDT